MWKIAIFLVGISRFILPFNIFSHPIFSSIASGFLDYIDCYLAFRARFTWKQYHLYDKLIDYWWYIFVLLYSWNTEIRIIILLLFIYRTVGQALTIITGYEKLLLYFPNAFEKYFIFYLFTPIFPQLHSVFYGYLVIIPLSISFAIGIYGEYQAHISTSFFHKGIFQRFHTWPLNQRHF